ADCKAVALQWLAVSYPSRRTKLSIARSENELVIQLPLARADNARAIRADVLRERRFRPGHLAIPVEIDAALHRNAVLRAVKRINCAAKGRDVHALTGTPQFATGFERCCLCASCDREHGQPQLEVFLAYRRLQETLRYQRSRRARGIRLRSQDVR